MKLVYSLFYDFFAPSVVPLSLSLSLPPLSRSVGLFWVLLWLGGESEWSMKEVETYGVTFLTDKQAPITEGQLRLKANLENMLLCYVTTFITRLVRTNLVITNCDIITNMSSKKIRPKLFVVCFIKAFSMSKALCFLWTSGDSRHLTTKPCRVLSCGFKPSKN